MQDVITFFYLNNNNNERKIRSYLFAESEFY